MADGCFSRRLPGDASATLANPCDDATSTSDKTGRLRALWVKNGSTKLFGRTYRWKGDQVASAYSCMMGASFGTQSFDYDRRLRLITANGPGGNRTYGYSGRGNRTTESDGANFSLTYGGSARVDELDERSASGYWVKYTYTHDSDGRATAKTGAVFTVGGYATPARSTTLDYGYQSRGGTRSTYRAALVKGLAYGYWYDGANRRWKKQYPVALVSDEFYYDAGHQMLEDRGVNKTLTAPTEWPIDEYVWLDGRPVYMVKSKFTALSPLTRLNETLAGQMCSRNDDSSNLPQACGTYYPVTDVIGRVVAMLDSAGAVAGASVEEYPFGRSNVRLASGDTAHPYTSSSTFGTMSLPTTPTGMTARARVKYHMHDVNSCATTQDFTYLANGAGTEITLPESTRQNGSFGGPLWSKWANLPADGQLKTKLTAYAGWTGCRSKTTLACRTQTWCLANPSDAFPYWAGASLESVEWKFYASSMTNSIWTPLLFPGQYYDAETELVENWNRYYDPSIGRYLQPEPMLQVPAYLQSRAEEGRGVPVYAYAQSNPVAVSDPTGLEPEQDKSQYPNIGCNKKTDTNCKDPSKFPFCKAYNIVAKGDMMSPHDGKRICEHSVEIPKSPANGGDYVFGYVRYEARTGTADTWDLECTFCEFTSVCTR